MSKGFLITGATGKQGGATIDALLASPPTSPTSAITILAVTRTPSSASAQALASKSPLIKLVHGDLHNIPALFASAKRSHGDKAPHAVFSVQVPMGAGQTPQTEEQQGKALVDGALKNGVRHFVYTSAERGGDAPAATAVPHFASKHAIETYLHDRTAGSGMSYTIIRPVAFMENFSDDFFGKVFGSAVAVGLGPAQKLLQMVSVVDVGHFAAQALLYPERHANRAINLAGDELTWTQMNDVFRAKTGRPAPATFDFLGSTLLWGVKEMGSMFKWMREEGFGADVQACRREHPGLLSLGDWIEKKSAFKTVSK